MKLSECPNPFRARNEAKIRWRRSMNGVHFVLMSSCDIRMGQCA